MKINQNDNNFTSYQELEKKIGYRPKAPIFGGGKGGFKDKQNILGKQKNTFDEDVRKKIEILEGDNFN